MIAKSCIQDRDRILTHSWSSADNRKKMSSYLRKRREKDIDLSSYRDSKFQVRSQMIYLATKRNHESSKQTGQSGRVRRKAEPIQRQASHHGRRRFVDRSALLLGWLGVLNRLRDLGIWLWFLTHHRFLVTINTYDACALRILFCTK